MLKGIDINSNNNVSDWGLVAKDGIQVLINKATEANFYQDKYFGYRYKTVRPLGIKFGAYHFAGIHGIETEAQYFLDYIKGYVFDTILFLDIEQPPTWYGWQWTKEKAIEYVNNFIPIIKKAGYEIGLYTNESFYIAFLKGNIDPSIKLWIANYGKQPADYPNISWQFTESETVNGVDGGCDVDYFNENILLSSASPVVNPTPEPVPVPTPAPTPVVSDDVKWVQENLNKFGYGLSVDGISGPKTLAAIKDFQSKHSLDADGIVGPKTRQAITDAVNNLNKPSGDPVTRTIQSQLNTILKAGLATDGIPGPKTTAAIKQFQGIMGLSQDGVVGPATQGAINQILSRPTDGVPYPHYEYATRYIQWRIGTGIDGKFGNGTAATVKRWQAGQPGLSADGVVGPASWSRLLG